MAANHFSFSRSRRQDNAVFSCVQSLDQFSAGHCNTGAMHWAAGVSLGAPIHPFLHHQKSPLTARLSVKVVPGAKLVQMGIAPEPSNKALGMSHFSTLVCENGLVLLPLIPLYFAHCGLAMPLQRKPFPLLWKGNKRSCLDFLSPCWCKHSYAVHYLGAAWMWNSSNAPIECGSDKHVMDWLITAIAAVREDLYTRWNAWNC